jgi:hypothetical protein
MHRSNDKSIYSVIKKTEPFQIQISYNVMLYFF